jgi:hypothetical protein
VFIEWHNRGNGMIQFVANHGIIGIVLKEEFEKMAGSKGWF